MKPVLEDFFQGERGQNNEYKPSTLENADGKAKVSASMVSRLIHLARRK